MKMIIAIALAAAGLSASAAFAESTVGEQRRALESAIASVNDDGRAGATRPESRLRAFAKGFELEPVGSGIGGARFGARDNWVGNYAAGRKFPPAGR